MNKKTLTSLFSEAVYQIPDYQRGYAWEEKQWKDFTQDIDALVEEKAKLTGHYTKPLFLRRYHSKVITLTKVSRNHQLSHSVMSWMRVRSLILAALSRAISPSSSSGF